MTPSEPTTTAPCPDCDDLRQTRHWEGPNNGDGHEVVEVCATCDPCPQALLDEAIAALLPKFFTE